MTQTASSYPRIAGGRCRVPDCAQAAKTDGLCSRHYRKSIRDSVAGSPGNVPWAHKIPAEVADDLREAFSYDPLTGVFCWKNSSTPCKNGKRADFEYLHGYRGVSRKQRNHFAHRVAWLFLTGNWPACQIDHINGDRADNRACNLREADSRQNNLNRGATSKSASGIKGVYWKKRERKWLAQISFGGKSKHLGFYASKEEAAQAYAAAAALLHGEFLHSSVRGTQP